MKKCLDILFNLHPSLFFHSFCVNLIDYIEARDGFERPSLNQLNVEKKEIPAAFWPLFKNTSFEFSKYESFAAFIMPKNSSDGNFRLFCAFIDFLQMFKVIDLVHKPILMTQKCKIIELRGFAHLGIYFKNSLGISRFFSV